MQIILDSKNNYEELIKYISDNNLKNIFVVCNDYFYDHKLYKLMNDLDNVNFVFFDKVLPNPTYESVCEGLEEYKINKCDSIIAVGGGSVIDVSKCIKAFNNMDDSKLYLNQEIEDNDIKLIVVPTTAGTGSEATHFAVVYYDGEKKSIADNCMIPNAVLFDKSFLKTLPIYQKKATMLDALSHSIESMWSINSTEESLEYSKRALELIVNNMDSYLKDKEESYNEILLAANYAGRAINITKTTAGHAMCYKLTSLYNVAHGHAAMLVNSELLPFMIENIDKCIDVRGKEYLCGIFNKLCELLKLKDLEELKNYFSKCLIKLELLDINVNYEDLDILVDSVNVERLSNNPVKLEKNDIREIYIKLFDKIKED